MFAHADGLAWDEVLLVLAPIVVIAALLLLANTRAKRLGRDDEAAPVAPADEHHDA